MKRLALIILALGIMLTGLSASAETEYLSREFTYRILEDGTVEITGFIGGVANLVINPTLDGRAVSAIAENAFSGSSDLVTVIMGESVRSIGTRAFYGCPNLRAVELPGCLETMGEDVFGECRALLSIKMKRQGEWFETVDGVLYHKKEKTLLRYPAAKTAERITVTEGTERIADKAFFGCINLAEAALPASLKEIGYRAFYGCTSLKTLDMRGAVSIADYAFCGCTNLSEMTLPAGLERIGYGAFSGCIAIRALDFAPGLKLIGDSAFCECAGLETLSLPEGTETIEPYAFYYCPKLTDVYLPESLISIGEGAFFDCANAVIHAKEGSFAFAYAQENGLAVQAE